MNSRNIFFPQSLGRRICVEALVLVLAGLAAAFIVNGLRPDGLAWLGWRPGGGEASEIGQTSVQDAMELHAAGQALFIDARSRDLFQQGRISDAVGLPSTISDQELAAGLESVPEDRPIVVYCEGQLCQAAETLARRLADMGYTHVMHMPAGIEGWVMAGGELEAGP